MKPRRKILWPASSFIVAVDSYPFHCAVAANMDLDSVPSILEGWGVSLTDSDRACFDCPASTSGRSIRLDSGSLVIWLKEWDETPIAHARLGHEVYHAVCMLMKFIGIHYSRKSDEAYAYAIENLTRAVLEEFAKPPSRRRTKP